MQVKHAPPGLLFNPQAPLTLASPPVQAHVAAVQAWEAAGNRPFRQRQQTLLQAKQGAVDAAAQRAMDHRQPQFATVFHTLQERLAMTKFEVTGQLLQHLGAPVDPSGWSDTTGALVFAGPPRVSNNVVWLAAGLSCFKTSCTGATSQPLLPTHLRHFAFAF